MFNMYNRTISKKEIITIYEYDDPYILYTKNISYLGFEYGKNSIDSETISIAMNNGSKFKIKNSKKIREDLGLEE